MLGARRDSRAVTERIAVIGLGYVGLPVAVGFARAFPNTVGFDVDVSKVEELRRGYDRNREISKALLEASELNCTSAESDRTGR